MKILLFLVLFLFLVGCGGEDVSDVSDQGEVAAGDQAVEGYDFGELDEDLGVDDVEDLDVEFDESLL